MDQIRELPGIYKRRGLKPTVCSVRARMPRSEMLIMKGVFSFLIMLLASSCEVHSLLDAKQVVQTAAGLNSTGVGFSVVHVHAPRSSLKFGPEGAGTSSGVVLYSTSMAGTKQHKQQMMKSSLKGSTTTLGQRYGEYYMIAKIGAAASAQEVLLIIDTGSELTWLQCAPCKGCAPIVESLYHSARSTSYRKIPCGSALCANSSQGTYAYCDKSACKFAAFYADGSFSYGDLATDILSLKSGGGGGSVTIENFLFGCAEADFEVIPTGASGILGLDLGRTGLPMQLGQQYNWKFSHCFPDKIWHLNSSGVVFFGEAHVQQQLHYTPLKPKSKSPFYHVSLLGISFNKQLVLLDDSEAVLDSGTSFTNLVSPAYTQLKSAFLQHRPAELEPLKNFSFAGLDSCFRVASSNFARVSKSLPSLALHIDEATKLELPSVSILLPVSEDQKLNQLRVCFAFLDAGPAEKGAANVIGNYQQQNLWIEYDIQNSRVGFAQASCATD